MASSDAQTLQKWQDYINDYEEKLQNHNFDLSTSSGRSSYTRMQAHLNSLRSKYAYLQQYYAQHGELPANVTFESIEGAGGAYRTEAGGEIKTITFEAGGNGGLTVSAPDFTGAYHWQGPPELIASSYSDREGRPQRYGIEITGPAGAGYISMDVTGTLFSGMNSTYHFHYETIPSIWSVSLNINNTIPVYNQTSPLGMNAFTFNGGVSWTLGEMTVPTDEPWKYYETKIKPHVPPGDDIYPDGYDPGKEDDPPEEGKPDRDATDEGEPPEVEEVKSVNSAMTKYYVLTPWQFDKLRQVLALTVQDTYNNPNDETKFLYRLGKLIKDGNTNRYETSQNNFIGDYLVSCRMYPFDLKESENWSGDPYTGPPATAITFGYNGANIDCTDWPDKVYSLFGVIQSCKNLTVTVPCRAGTTNVADVTFLDFEPFCKYSIILPYLGEFEIPARSVLCATLDIHYQIDFSSGTIQAVVYSKGGYNSASTEGTDTTPPTTILQKAGVIGCSLSVTGNNIVKQGDQMVIAQMGMDKARLHSIVSDVNANLPVAAKTAGGALSTGLEEGPQAGLAQWATSTVSGKIDKIMNIPNRVEEIFGNYTNMCAAGINKSQASRDVPFILSQGTNISPLMNLNQVAVRTQRAIAFYPNGFSHMYGLPKQQTMKIGSLKGFVQTAAFDCSGIGSGTEPVPTEIEQKMIVDAMKNGAYQNT